MKNALAKLAAALGEVHPLILTLTVISTIGMNLLANKSIDTGVPWLALDCGILLSWLAFLSMDIATHCYGPHKATLVSLTALGLNLLMVLVFFVASIIPGVWSESFVEGSEDIINAALDKTFGGTWFIILGSSIAYAVSAVVNNFLNWGIGQRVEKNDFSTFALRSYLSTFTAQFVDNITFALIVSRTFFGWSLIQCITCAITGAVLELLFEIFFSPIGYRISRKLLRGEPAEEA